MVRPNFRQWCAREATQNDDRRCQESSRSPTETPRDWRGQRLVADVATCGYAANMETGIRELKDNLSRYIRRVEAGQRIAVTAHGRVVAELVPPGTATRTSPGSRWDELIATGVLHPPVEPGDPFEDWPDIRLPPGTAAELIDADRGEA
jgi:prevent-host-death family protein